MRIGVSFWGFLYQGVSDTPDGGRIHRLPFLISLIEHGHSIFCLQKNRDYWETNTIITVENLIFNNRFPEIDVLLIEYRWPIKGRNTEADKHLPGYTPDLERQEALIKYYKNKISIIVWDKDLKFTGNANQFTVVENTLLTSKGRHSLFFPYDDALKDTALMRLSSYETTERKNDLVYVGNQYERDESFDRFINQAGRHLVHRPIVYGNWTKYPEIYQRNLERFQAVEFRGRLHFKQIHSIYSDAFSTVLIAPSRYYKKGQITQRLFESITNLTIPFVPRDYQGVDEIIVNDLFVSNGREVAEKIREFKDRGKNYIKEILEQQLKNLKIFSTKKQSKAFIEIVKKTNA